MPSSASKEIRLNMDTNLLKLVAIVTMLIDHVGKVFFPQYPILRIIGRIAFPLFAYCLTVGCVYTRSMPKYLLRVALLALITQPFYVLALGHTQAVAVFNPDNNFLYECARWYLNTWQKPSILATIFAGLLLLWTFRQKNYAASGAVFVLIWAFQRYLDYGLYGIGLMVLFFALRAYPFASMVWVAGYMAAYGLNWSSVSLATLSQIRVTPVTQFYALLALPLIYLPTNTKLRLPKSLFYAFYPGHLIAIYLISQFVR